MPRISPPVVVLTKQERQVCRVQIHVTALRCDQARTVFFAGEGLSKNTGTLS